MITNRRTFLKGGSALALGTVVPWTWANRARAAILNYGQVGWYASSAISGGFVNSGEFQGRLTWDPPYSVLQRFYNVFLLRSASMAELDAWYAYTVVSGWFATAQGFLDSGEYLGRVRGDPQTQLRDLYVAFLDRQPAPEEVEAWLPYLGVYEAVVEPSFAAVGEASKELGAPPKEGHPLGPAVIVLAAAITIEGSGIAFKAGATILEFSLPALQAALVSGRILPAVGLGFAVGAGIGSVGLGVGTLILAGYIAGVFLNEWISARSSVNPLFQAAPPYHLDTILPAPGYNAIPTPANTSIGNPTGGWGWYL